MNEVKFRERTTMVVDNNPNGNYEESIGDHTLLVSDTVICEWDSDDSEYGYQANAIYPAYWDGKKSWLHTTSWIPGSGYCADGGGDNILSWEDGVDLLLRRGAYEQAFENSK